MSQRILLLAASVWVGLSALADGRTWTDSTGNYRTEADLVALNETTVVLKKADNHLVAVPMVKLSKVDRTYLESKETAETARRSADAMQTWTMASGLKVTGRVVDYGRKDLTVQRRRGKIYVNDRLYDNLPEVYQLMLPKIVTHFEKTEIDGKKGLVAWATKQRGQARTFTCEGVILELANGDEYGIPFFFFSPEDLKILQPGWDRWLAANQDQAKQQQESFLLATQAQAYQQDRAMNQQIALMQLQMEGYQAGLFDLWEVRMFPKPGVASPPLTVVVPARDSRTATMEAVSRNPGFVAGPVSRVSRK
ncbi:MAG: SHD1 domain-containing protein [Pirellulales bacterium]